MNTSLLVPMARVTAQTQYKLKFMTTCENVNPHESIHMSVHMYVCVYTQSHTYVHICRYTNTVSMQCSLSVMDRAHCLLTSFSATPFWAPFCLRSSICSSCPFVSAIRYAAQDT